MIFDRCGQGQLDQRFGRHVQLIAEDDLTGSRGVEAMTLKYWGATRSDGLRDEWIANDNERQIKTSDDGRIKE